MHDSSTSSVTGTSTSLGMALELADQGCFILPCHTVAFGQCTCPSGPECKHPGKHPRTKSGVNDASRDREKILNWWHRWRGDVNFGWRLDGLGVVDVDVSGGKQGMDQLTALIAQHEPLPRTLTIRTGRGGLQYVFELPDDISPARFKDKIDKHIDFKRGPGHYVMVPGSMTSQPYELVDESDTAPLPEWLTATLATGGQKEPTPQPTLEGQHDLVALIELPPDDPGRGNSWLTQVAGHLAQMEWATGRPNQARYLGMLAHFDQQSEEPHAHEVLTKTAQSIWKSEADKRDDDSPKSKWVADTGWLFEQDEHLCTCIKGVVNKQERLISCRFTDFTIRAVGVVDEGEGRSSYDVEIGRRNVKIRTMVDAKVLSDQRSFEAWLSGFRIGVFPPRNDAVPAALHPGHRLRHYLESQNPPLAAVADYLGWHPRANGFVTLDSIIRADGQHKLDGIRPAPSRVTWMKQFRYGFEGSEKMAIEHLRHVMELHYPDYTSVFAAWLTMLVLKGQYPLELFPIFNVESAKETGKSHGFFPLMMRLFGSLSSGGQSTGPATRDQIAAHNNGVIWVDDAAQVRYIADLLRQMTGEGERSKKSADNHTIETIRLRSGLLISGEGLGSVSSEPAMKRSSAASSSQTASIAHRRRSAPRVMLRPRPVPSRRQNRSPGTRRSAGRSIASKRSRRLWP